MDQHIVRPDNNQPEFRAWANPQAPLVMLSVDKIFLHVSTSLTRAQTAQLIAALQDADQELAAREVADAPHDSECCVSGVCDAHNAVNSAVA